MWTENQELKGIDKYTKNIDDKEKALWGSGKEVDLVDEEEFKASFNQKIEDFKASLDQRNLSDS